MSFWSRFEEFVMKWFCGPDSDPNVRREYGYTIGAESEEKPRFSRNNIVTWVDVVNGVRQMRSENHYLSILFFDAEDRTIGYRYLYFDFDSEQDVELAKREAMEFVEHVRRRFGAEPITYFSGHKGYGVVVALDRFVDFATYSKLWKALVQPLTLSTLDRKVLDARRLHRIPYTYNVKPGHRKLSYLVDPKTFKRMRMEDFDWSSYQPLKLDYVEHLLVTIEGFEVPKPKRVSVSRKKRELKPLPPDPAELDACDAVPPCIRNIISALKQSGDLDHYQRLVLVWYLKWVGYDKEAVIDLFKRFARDFNEKVTRYQVEYAYGERGSRKNWLTPSCRWMKEHGLCLECGWNRNPTTYTYVRALVPEEVRQRFFRLVSRESSGDRCCTWIASPSS